MGFPTDLFTVRLSRIGHLYFGELISQLLLELQSQTYI